MPTIERIDSYADELTAIRRDLHAHPECEVVLDGRTRPHRARDAAGEERERLWRLACRLWRRTRG